MKRALLLFCLLLAARSIAQAHLQPGITAYVAILQTVCIAKVTAIEKGIATFVVEEIVKGSPPAVLKLTDLCGNLSVNSEWLLASTRAKQNSVGWALKGDFGWVNAPIQRWNGAPRLVSDHELIDPKLAKDPSKGLTLEDLKKLAITPLPKK